MAPRFPRAREELTGGYLRGVLAASNTIGSDVEVSISGLEVVGAGLAGEVVRIAVDYSKPTPGPKSIIAKFSTRNEANLDVFASFDMYRREVSFYRDLPGAVMARIPFCYGAEATEDGRSCILLLEDFPGHRAGDQVSGCSVEQARLALVESARLHASFQDRPPPGSIRPYVGPYSETLAARTFAAWDKASRHMPAEIRPLRDTYADVAPALDRWITGGSMTVAHGDFRLDNMLFGPPGSPSPVVIVDWQMPLWSRGVEDVSYLLTQSMDAALREANEESLLELYVVELEKAGGRCKSDTIWRDYRIFSLINYAVAVCIAVLDPVDDRAESFMRTTVERASAAFLELELAELLNEFRSG